MSSLVKPTYERDKEGKVNARKILPRLNDLHKYVNVNDEGLCLVIAWLLISLYQNSNVDAPILWIEGERNTGNTTAVKFLKRLIAPDTAMMRSQYMSEKEFLAAINSQYVSVIDNVSTIAPKFSDMLCRAVTGDKIRTVTTESGTFKIHQHANIIVNSLNTVSKTSELPGEFSACGHSICRPKIVLQMRSLKLRFRRFTYIFGALLLALR